LSRGRPSAARAGIPSLCDENEAGAEGVSRVLQRRVTAQQRGELAEIVLVDLEIEIVLIKRDRRVDVRDDVSDGCRSAISCYYNGQLAETRTIDC